MVISRRIDFNFSFSPSGSQIMRLGELEVSVVCEDRTLEEYRPTKQNLRTITCFIPSEAGKVIV